MLSKLSVCSLESLPKYLSPEATENREGFVHPVHIEGIAEKVTLNFIIRDFTTGKLKDYEDLLKAKIG